MPRLVDDPARTVRELDRYRCCSVAPAQVRCQLVDDHLVDHAAATAAPKAYLRWTDDGAQHAVRDGGAGWVWPDGPLPWFPSFPRAEAA